MGFSDLNYISFGERAGYAIASANYLKFLQKAILQLNWKTIIQGQNVQYGITSEFYDDLPEELKLLWQNGREFNDSGHQIIHTTPEHFPALINRRMQNIGMTVWETDTFPENWRTYFEGLDKVIVPCSWNVEIFEKAKINQPVYKLPHISEFAGEQQDYRFLNIPDDTFVFLNVSVWENRKNMDKLVKAYLNAFTSKDNVILILKTSKRDVSGPFFKIGKKKKYIKTKNKVRILSFQHGWKNAKIIVLPHHVTAEEMKGLYTRANAYVSLCHAEGWGMGQYESAWYGKPVITTNYSGYLDFMDQDNAYLIDSSMTDVVPNEWDKNILKGHQWAEPDADHAIVQMREVYTNYDKARAKGNRLKDNVELNFSPEKITRDFMEIIKD